MSEKPRVAQRGNLRAVLKAVLTAMKSAVTMADV